MKRIIPFAFIVASVFILSACWDSYELEERANILGISIDLVEKSEVDENPQVTHLDGTEPERVRDTYFKVTAQLAVPGKIKLGPEGSSGEGSEKTTWILTTYGHTLKDTLANMQQQLAEKLYLGHLQIVVISEEIAKKEIKNVNDFLRRNHEVRRTAWFIISEEDAEAVLKAAPPVETVPALYLADTLDNAVRFGKLPEEYLGKYWIDLSGIGIEPILPVAKVINKERILISGLAYFKQGLMVGKMAPLEIGGYLGMVGESKGGYSFMVEVEDAVYMLTARKRTSSIKIDVNNNVPSAHISIHLKAIIDEVTGSNILTKEMVEKIEKEAEKKEEEVLKNLMNKLQEDQSDILGLGARIRARHSHYWDNTVKTTEKWGEIYKEMDIKINVHTELIRAGMEWE